MIPFLDLQKLNAPYKEAFQHKFEQFLTSGNYILGPSVVQFEKEFAAYCGTNFCVGVSSGLAALTLILRGFIELGQLHEGQKVIVAANTYFASILAIKRAGLEPVLVEPDEKTFNLNVASVHDKITTKTKAILVTHLYGQLASMKALSTFALKNGLLLIADAAQAAGVKDDFSSQNFADASGYSFYPTKNLGALGDAGAVTTDDKQLAETIKTLRNYGSSQKNKHDYWGYNARLDEIQAAFLSKKLPDLDLQNDVRRQIAKRYLNKIKNEKIQLPFWDGSTNHVFHLFVVRVKNRADFCAYLTKNEIGYAVHYPTPPHHQKALTEYAGLTLPITEKIHREVVSIPLNPALSEEQINTIITVLNRY